MRGFLTVAAALLVAGGSAYYLFAGMQRSPGPETAVVAAPPPPVQVDVFVPAGPLAAGTILSPELLTRLALDPGAVGDEMIVADEAGRTLVTGSVARHALARGLPIARSSVVQPGERGFLAAVLPRGKRAISIPLGEVAGLSGLVMPGDRVDIILTYSVEGQAIDAERDVRASETVLSNLRVLALDQRLQEPAAPGAPAAHPIARMATLEVTPREAEMLTLAVQLGDLSLVLNSVEDGGPAVELAAAEATAGPARPAAGDAPAAVLRALRGEVVARAGGGLSGAFAGSAAEAAAAPVTERAALPSGRRVMTLDSQVTTLLLRDPVAATAAEPAAAAAEPLLAERLSRIQVVRGRDSRAHELGAAAVAAAPAAEGARALTAAGPLD